jgi:hypothetical protein
MDWIFGGIYVVIGFLLTTRWYSPNLDKIDKELIDRGYYEEELGFFKLIFWSFAMTFFWPILGLYEKRTNFRHWYPKGISPLQTN